MMKPVGFGIPILPFHCAPIVSFTILPSIFSLLLSPGFCILGGWDYPSFDVGAADQCQRVVYCVPR